MGKANIFARAKFCFVLARGARSISRCNGKTIGAISAALANQHPVLLAWAERPSWLGQMHQHTAAEAYLHPVLLLWEEAFLAWAEADPHPAAEVRAHPALPEAYSHPTEGEFNKHIQTCSSPEHCSECTGQTRIPSTGPLSSYQTLDFCRPN